jgi:hypothetical protein
MENVRKHLDFLGLKVVDKVTGFKGICTSIGFDLYGCVQAVINPGLDKDGVAIESVWFDIARLKVTDKKPVMDVPDFDFGKAAEGKKGPAEKPIP